MSLGNLSEMPSKTSFKISPSTSSTNSPEPSSRISRAVTLGFLSWFLLDFVQAFLRRLPGVHSEIPSKILLVVFRLVSVSSVFLLGILARIVFLEFRLDLTRNSIKDSIWDSSRISTYQSGMPSGVFCRLFLILPNIPNGNPPRVKPNSFRSFFFVFHSCLIFLINVQCSLRFFNLPGVIWSAAFAFLHTKPKLDKKELLKLVRYDHCWSTRIEKWE